MKISDFKIHDTEKLDAILIKCLQLLLDKQQSDSNYWGRVSACLLDTDNRAIYGVNHISDSDNRRVHAERAAMNNYVEKYGQIPGGSIIITTLSPCSNPMDERYGESCTDLINDSDVHKVYCGYDDPTQSNNESYLHKKFHIKTTRNDRIYQLCKSIADTFLKSKN